MVVRLNLNRLHAPLGYWGWLKALRLLLLLGRPLLVLWGCREAGLARLAARASSLALLWRDSASLPCRSPSE